MKFTIYGYNYSQLHLTAMHDVIREATNHKLSS